MSEYKVLIVEDSPTMRQLISFALKRMRGVRIVEANDGVDGLKKLAAEKFDLIFTDINIAPGTRAMSTFAQNFSPQYAPIFRRAPDLITMSPSLGYERNRIEPKSNAQGANGSWPAEQSTARCPGASQPQTHRSPSRADRV